MEGAFPAEIYFYAHVRVDELSYRLNYDTITVFIYSYLFSNK